MYIKAYNNDKLVFDGSLSDFMADNPDDVELVAELEKLKTNDTVEFNFYHSGNWKIYKNNTIYLDHNFENKHIKTRAWTFRKGRLILLEGEHLNNNYEYVEFQRGWYDEDLNFIANITPEDEAELELWYYIPF